MGRWWRMPSWKKKNAARTSLKRVVRHRMGFKAPRGWGWLTNPKRAAYNRKYNRGCLVILLPAVALTSAVCVSLLCWLFLAAPGTSLVP
jgi:hypothetical protein